MTNQDLVSRAQNVLFQNYRTQPIALVRGEGTYVFDADGKRYLDFIGGIATVSVGHANAKVREAVLSPDGQKLTLDPAPPGARPAGFGAPIELTRGK